ncbi:hypothetical protein TBLA_0I00770 [Henningerozyma blattae CBS 6284]|uniref:W2 domain-containing protein n=1 Tax=Henningerozyma blattae (strain ATCC 34711 / CBS 6284 / DSM 70876 / NBRC 10599 / NRRL Y-10934 / UCD 77-7) TaxID=1071380 RepID=I2H8N3_HENB6|nr:hypothetical protein TBLA_0I00770 [Tetrapisispora blattae CBS 6284]CCH62735.1 hypothetical protein TBLA_0I00770 [Tetrapisispora blattae CBS 6284]
MSINICRDNHDPFYRYKMPPIQAKVEGRGNGIKTAVLNASDVARALNRPTPYIIKYFGFELGAQTSISVDKDRYLVNGVHEPAKLQDALDGFINRFILCGSCKNPETEIVITKDNDLVRDCKACGKRTPMDLRHKLSSFILKNPPDSIGGSKKKKKAATASANVRGGGVSISDLAQGKSQTATGDDETAHEDDDELARQIKAAAKDLETIEVKDDEWAVDMSEEAIRARAKELQASENAISSEKMNKLDQYGEWIIEEKESSELPSDIELYKKAAELDVISDSMVGCVIAQCIFSKDIVSEIEEHAAFLNKIINEDKDFEKNFLGGIERFLGLENKDLIPTLPKILLNLYNNDIISEEVIMKFGTKVSKRYVPKEVSKKVRRAAKPFITWLENAESEDEDSDEE